MKCLIIIAALVVIALAKPVRKANRIVGGVDVDRPGKYPWQASLQTTSNFHSCGAVVISTTWVLTATHCVIRATPASRKVVVGLHDKDTRLQGMPVDKTIAQIYLHPSYSAGPPSYWAYDAAVLRMSTPIVFNDFVKAIGLADEGEDFASNDNCIISGWGRLYGGGPSPNVLQEANIDVLTQAECRANRPNQIYDYHICVGKKITQDQGACQGDSGGPLSCPVNGVWKVAGLTSWGNSFCATTQASVYARVGETDIRGFIRDITGM